MKKKEVREFIKERIDYYKKLMRLGRYDISVCFCEYDDGNSAMRITTDIRYLQAKICISKEVFKHDKKFIEDCIRHELCHIILEPMQNWIRMNTTPNEMDECVNRLENAVEHMSRIISY